MLLDTQKLKLNKKSSKVKMTDENVTQILYTIVYASGRKIQDPVNPKTVQKALLEGDGWITEKFVV